MFSSRNETDKVISWMALSGLIFVLLNLTTSYYLHATLQVDLRPQIIEEERRRQAAAAAAARG